MEKKDYVFLHETDLNHYVAEAFCVRCFDDRFWKTYKNFLRSKGVEHIDAESVAGGAKIFASPDKEEHRDFMVSELEKSIRLHHTKKVMLFSHHDCGAYGGVATFGGDEEKEFEFHMAELAKAAGFVRQKFPELEVETYFIDQKGIIKI